MNKFKVLSLQISGYSFAETLHRIIHLALAKTPSYVCFANVHMVIEANDTISTATKINNATLVCADGVPLVKSVQFLFNKKIERVAGMDMMPALIEECEKKSIPIFFYGTTDEILNAIKERVKLENPSLKIAGMFSPPFKKLSEEEKKQHIEMINNSAAGVVFVALGCPKQELWMAENYTFINAPLLGVGGAFPVYAGIQKRAPKWIRKLSLEWLFRFFQDPIRLFKRYLYTNSKFVLLLTKELFSTKLVKQK
jgi:N-acetylglucosaminyldiphosphoundecaprenol N-acetyl-beta-D-mannosaminyltransferase